MVDENFGEITNFIWSVADLLRDIYKRGKYADVILPFTVLRRLDCVLAPTKENVLKVYNEYRSKLEDLSALLKNAAGQNFYNTSKFDFAKLLSDPVNIKQNMYDYLNGFSDNMRDVIDRFKLRQEIQYLYEKNLLYKVVSKFNEIDLHPDKVSNHAMGTIFEELLRKFNEANNENPGEHFTPRDVIKLMVRLVTDPDNERIKEEGIIVTVCDPACGTGGILTEAKDYILNSINPRAKVELFGQEIQDETYAVCKSDMIIKGENADNIKPGSSFSHDGFQNQTFDYILTNPPFGKDWNQDREAIEQEHARGFSGRFGAGLPRSSDGQMLFLQHMISKMHKPETGEVTRIAIVHNGSPLFTGGAGSGESEIRRWIIENDWLEAIVGLSTDLFYNTNISTYMWVLSSKKSPERREKIQLIDARSIYHEMRKSLGSKRKELTGDDVDRIMKLYSEFLNSENSKIYPGEEFGYRTIVVERPLRRNYKASPERIERLRQNLDQQKNIKDQESIISAVAALDREKIYKSKTEFLKDLEGVLFLKGIPLKNSLIKIILDSLGERDESAEISTDSKGKPEPDPELRDTENVPLKEDIRSYFEREVLTFVPDAWIDESKTKIGYEIPFNRIFYKYVPPRPLEEIDRDIKQLADEVMKMLGEITQ